jgi:hypothetical protein
MLTYLSGDKKGCDEICSLLCGGNSEHRVANYRQTFRQCCLPVQHDFRCIERKCCVGVGDKKRHVKRDVMLIASLNSKHKKCICNGQTESRVLLCRDPGNSANINLRVMLKVSAMFLCSNACSSLRDVFSYLSDVLSAFYGALKGVLLGFKCEVGHAILPHCYGSLFPNTSLLSL